MNFRWVIGLVLPWACAAGEPDVLVSLHNTYLATPGVIRRAEAITRAMFSGVGVDLVWNERANLQHKIHSVLSLDIAFEEGRQNDGKDGETLAEARPFTAITSATQPQAITVRYGRVRDAIGPDKELEAVLVAHILAHEITHMVECVDHHSETGVMKARWDRRDYVDMEWKPLLFAPEDIELIHQGLRDWKARTK